MYGPKFFSEVVDELFEELESWKYNWAIVKLRDPALESWQIFVYWHIQATIELVEFNDLVRMVQGQPLRIEDAEKLVEEFNTLNV